ncbi:MAG TPA: sensor histidine kinase [Candidatus Intestinimonas merdavium]|uniref:histidine kinase n=1 Tax=Candidatus Intestinimonas merdavium TaxID=2838622 RepID=A0A9D1Z4P5_9FIRM|nr:sensor histidine kinase [Candidatus Intestinimonas merdavium]
MSKRLQGRFSRGSIRYVMFASFTISALVAVLLTCLTLYARFSKQMDDAIQEENQILVSQVNQSLSTYLRDMIRLSDSICYNVVKNTDLEREGVGEEIRLLYDTYSDYVENVALFTRTGELLATAPAAKVKDGIDVTGEEWFTSAMAQTENLHFGVPAIQTLFVDAENNYKWVVSLSCAVELTQGGGAQLGVLLIDLKYSALTALFQSVKFSGSGYVYLVDGTGNLIYHPERTLIATGRVRENSLQTAARSDGIYTEVWEGARRSVIVQSVGYTGWKVVGVVERPGFTMSLQQTLPFLVVIICAYVELLILMNVLLSRKITEPLRRLRESVGQVEEGAERPPIYVGGTAETRELGTAIQTMVDRMRQLTADMVREHEQKQKSELNALQAQINPHFLYNTLDIIVWMIENGQREDAIRVVTALARFFRVSLSKGRNIIPVRDELEHVRNYLLIQEMRYKNKFRYQITCPEACANLTTIKLVVQPIVENAIYHSMDFMDGDGLIDIRADTDGRDLTITVSDNGLGMPPDVVERLLTASPQPGAQTGGKRGSGIGLRNVQERIRLYFGSEYGVTIQSEPDEGTVVTLHLPAVPYGEMEDT